MIGEFRYYLYGKHFKLYTDRKALTYIHTQKQTNQMIEGWLEELLELDFEVIHLPGIMNVLPDAISRLYDADDSPIQFNMIGQRLVDAEDHQKEVSETERKILLDRTHLMGHFGYHSMIAALKEQGYFWLSMKNNAIRLCEACIICQRFNISKAGFHPLKTIEAVLPLDDLAIDLKEYPKSRQGNKFCLFIVDICSRFVWLHALPDKESKTIAIALWSTISNFGLPPSIQSDIRTEFVNCILKAFANAAGIDHRVSCSGERLRRTYGTDIKSGRIQAARGEDHRVGLTTSCYAALCYNEGYQTSWINSL